MQNIMNQIPESIMKPHDPNDDPFASLADDSSNQLTSPLEYGSGISYLVAKETKLTEETPATKKEEDHKEEHTESSTGEDVDEDVVEGDNKKKDDVKKQD